MTDIPQSQRSPLDDLQRYMVPCGHGIGPHPAGLLYRRVDVDPIFAAIAAERDALRRELDAAAAHVEAINSIAEAWRENYLAAGELFCEADSRIADLTQEPTT